MASRSSSGDRPLQTRDLRPRGAEAAARAVADKKHKEAEDAKGARPSSDTRASDSRKG